MIQEILTDTLTLNPIYISLPKAFMLSDRGSSENRSALSFTTVSWFQN